MKKLLLLLVLPFAGKAQDLPADIIQKIDNVFQSFTSSSPGCAVAVSRNGKLVFQKGYGQANLEYNIPITPSTVFHIASESKQYVAFCMLLLEKEGKLSLDDDIRKHLDFVPDFGATITIRQLIYHISGLRDQWQLLANAGWQLDDVIKQEHVIKLVSKQRALNFNPGDEFMYCNTGYTLMAEIVKKVSGLTLREYADKNIFQPLGMKDTHFHDNYEELVPGRAYSYYAEGGKYRHSVLSYSIVGATSLFTTVTDELKWLNNYETGQVGGKELIEKMFQVGTLNDGRKLTYAFALGIEKYKGWNRIGHGGADAGYRTYTCRFPEKNLNIVVFSNVAYANTWDFASKVADAFITENKEEKKNDPVFVTDSSLLKKLQGKFYTERGDQFEMAWQNGKLMRKNVNTGAVTTEIKLSQDGVNRYKSQNGSVIILNEQSKTTNRVMEFKLESPTNTITFKRQPAVAQKITAEFVGKYYNPETEAFYEITEKNGQLFINHRKYSTESLTNIAPDQFTTPYWWMDHIRFVRNKQQKIVAFEVNADRLQHLRYEKVDPAKGLKVN